MTSALSGSSLFFSVLSLFFLRSVRTATTYLGCFFDQYPEPIRVLPVETGKSDDMTIGLCINRCLDLATPFIRYAGVETGEECWCGDKDAQYWQLGQQMDGACDTPCRGDINQTCGADFHIQVYDLALLNCTTPQLSNGNVISNSGEFVQVRMFASIICDEGYDLIGPTYLQCIVRNSNITEWSEPHPECQASSTTKSTATGSTDGGEGVASQRTSEPVSPTVAPMSNATGIIAGSAAGAGLLLIVLVIIIIIVCLRKRNQRTKTGENPQKVSRPANNNNDDQLSTSASAGQKSDNPLADNMYDHTPTAQPNNSIPLYAVVNQTTPSPVVKTASKRPTVQAYAYTDCTVNSPTKPNGRANNNNDDQLGTSVTVGQSSDNPLAENMYAHTPTAEPNNSIPLYAVVNQTTQPPVVKMASKRPTDQAYAYTECSINPPTMPNGDRQPIFADGDVMSGCRDSGWVDNNIYARTDNNGGEEGVDNAAYATVNRNQETHAAVNDEEKEGWAENSIYVTSS